MAFSAWLAQQLKRDVRLPTEWQWERAARGRHGAEFPWGREYIAGYANINETALARHFLARTSAVGIYPQGASLERVLDLCGNVWEWCLNGYHKPDHIQLGGRKARVLRGGSWYSNRVVARADYRVNYEPDDRYNEFGFRVVVSSSI